MSSEVFDTDKTIFISNSNNQNVNPYKAISFDDQIKTVFANRGYNLQRNIIVSAGPPIYAEFGLVGDFVIINRSTTNKRHITKRDHLKDYEEWIKLVNVLDQPVAKAGPIDGAYRFYYDIGANVPVVAVVEKRQSGRYSFLVLIKTAFYRGHGLEKDLESGYVKE